MRRLKSLVNTISLSFILVSENYPIYTVNQPLYRPCKNSFFIRARNSAIDMEKCFLFIV